MQTNKPMIIAHRGAAGEAPENTLGAFKLALEQGCDAFELDIHLTKDGEIVVIHDHTLDRTTTGSGHVTALTLEEIRQFDAGSWFSEAFKGERVPTLAEVFDLAPPHIQINVEVKGSVGQGMEEKLVELLREKNRVQSVFVSSFHFDCLATLNRLEPELKVGLLYSMWLQEHALLPKAAGVRAYSLHPQHTRLTSEAVALAMSTGLAVFPWTADSETDLQRMIDMKVTGIITDYPGRLYRMLHS